MSYNIPLLKKILIILEILIILVVLSAAAVHYFDMQDRNSYVESNNLTSTFANGEIHISQSDLPAFADAVLSQPDNWSAMNFNGMVISKPQALYILSTAVSQNSSDDISVGVILQADKSNGVVDSGSINQTEYMDMSHRVSQGIIDKGDKCPDYAGIRVKGEPDISYEKLVNLFAMVLSKDYPKTVNVSEL